MMEAELKKICQSIKAKGNLFSKDWDLFPLPSLPREGNSIFNNPIIGPNY